MDDSLVAALSPALSPPNKDVRNLAGRHRHLGSGQLTSDTLARGLWSCLVRRYRLASGHRNSPGGLQTAVSADSERSQAGIRRTIEEYSHPL
ncbi:hypothetical protein CGCF415_v008303 [Colletotrichum fructicola]|uniref:Uncharacterized protein n=1 Tax=Colletotrichum fructicola (strain Nara gc5) TaxID=1213859 RepID=A0A7J6IWI0_COLFN|nr:uncharacterized protein CGMCC3_g1284 [Colletotrichum fructicola]KAF4480856.1 hypothetical protein CGGC5_v010707 [Colletotrichum fructicola Nara gc5]KAE9583014.1 hypothetical protein CGMCC3_g1284 [Colletotrichum fructicola]KAF4412391.1 hypothetical protein CFRS1_v002407 [Colletotrichum fructicola]KAF4887629.1 hypothetical protein CGCFRS4_v010378 [Colletotrichum fructicola]KAF4905518.1 hypothetical protein CGCF415_v008303 [Colletotrichum fructicola]